MYIYIYTHVHTYIHEHIFRKWGPRTCEVAFQATGAVVKLLGHDDYGQILVFYA